MISQTQKVVDLLTEYPHSDRKLSEKLNISRNSVQTKICNVNYNKKKYKEFTILRSGKMDNLVRELVTSNSGENVLIDGSDKIGRKAIRQLDKRKKLLSIALNTREGQENRINFIANLQRQNLETSIEALKMLQ